jgi:hypothetical protein
VVGRNKLNAFLSVLEAPLPQSILLFIEQKIEKMRELSIGYPNKYLKGSFQVNKTTIRLHKQKSPIVFCIELFCHKLYRKVSEGLNILPIIKALISYW